MKYFWHSVNKGDDNGGYNLIELKAKTLEGAEREIFGDVEFQVCEGDRLFTIELKRSRYFTYVTTDNGNVGWWEEDV